MISENQGLEKSRSISDPRKFPGLHPEKNPVAKHEKKSRFAEPETNLAFEIDLDFSRP